MKRECDYCTYRKEIEIDGSEIYDSSTGETVGELENLNREQLEELLEENRNAKN